MKPLSRVDWRFSIAGGIRKHVAGIAGGLVLAASASASAGAVDHGSRILFVESSFGGRSTSCDLYVINADGSGRRELLRNAADPAWSPSGKLVAFDRRCGEGSQIFVMRSDASGVRKLTSTGTWSAPAWSPDGRKIAFEGKTGLYVMNADGSSIRKVSSSDGFGHPAWSPDGRQIAFPDSVSGGGDGIFVISAGGGRERALTNVHPSNLHVDDVLPAWSPDGRTIAFDRSFFNGTGYDDDIGLVHPDGRGLRWLTRGGLAQGPAWSPDGRRLAYTKATDKGADLWLMSANGSGRHRLLHNTGRVGAESAAWSPAGG